MHFLAICFAVSLPLIHPVFGNCNLGEFACNDRSCISGDQFCDGRSDCPNGEDEPQHCVPCGRVYYGVVGKTYEFQVLWPRKGSQPSACNLTLVAAGGPHGDLVQLVLRKFSMGKLHSQKDRGCPHGHMQIIENQRKYRPGFWCGNGVGVEMYFSETPSVTVLLTMLPTDNDVTALDSFSSFYFKMAYKFLRMTEAVVRYGPPSAPKFTGIRDPTTVCNGFFSNCDMKPCYIQSPNFPGMYPRNTTCYYHLSQEDSPSGMKAVMTLEQKAAHLIHIKSLLQYGDNTKNRTLKLYDDCYYLGDYVRIYDGNSTQSPVLITFCRGESLPEIVSSGPYLLIEFTTSAFDSPQHEYPWKFMSGFELIAKVRFVSDSLLNPTCQFYINGNVNKTGWVQSPVQSVARNTTCTWHFIGPNGHLVWLIFASYFRMSQIPQQSVKLCEYMLSVSGGNYSATPFSYCSGNRPRICDRGHQLLNNKAVTSCSSDESYISTSTNATIEQNFAEGSVVTKVYFMVKYEFVDVRLPGEFLRDPCDRLIRSNSDGRIHTLTEPKNVFLYGRGGRSNLRCSWILQGKENEIIKLYIKSFQSSEDSSCENSLAKYTTNLECNPTGFSFMALAISEWPWTSIEIPRACLCASDKVPLTIRSRSSVLSINFTAEGQSPSHDASNYKFLVGYEFLTTIKCSGGSRRLIAPAGEIIFGDEESKECAERPWLLTAPVGHSILLTLKRAVLANGSCAADSRLYFMLPGESNPLAAICPSPDPSSTVSLLWPPIPEISGSKSPQSIFREENEEPVLLIVHWEQITASKLSLKWLRIWRPHNVTAEKFNKVESAYGLFSHGAKPQEGTQVNLPCRELCPELGACIPAELWCDGHQHCPKGSDETLGNCVFERVPWLYLTMLVITLTILLLISASAFKKHHEERHHDAARRVSTQESILPPKDNQHRLSAYSPDFTDMDFETTV